jgi:hypothetical protein
VLQTMATSDPPPLTTLKRNHSLRGKDLFPLLMRFREERSLLPVLAGLSRSRPVDGLEVSELKAAIQDLTGRTASDLCSLAGKDEDRNSLRHCLHLVIIHSNEVGAPQAESIGQEEGSRAPKRPATQVCES